MSNKTVYALFPDAEMAATAAGSLVRLGFPRSGVSIEASHLSLNDPDHRSVEHAFLDAAADEVVGPWTAALVGSAVGATVLFLARMGDIRVPSLADLYSGGTLTAVMFGALLGAVIGGVAKLTINALQRADAGESFDFYESQVRHRGRALVTIRADEDQVSAIDELFSTQGRIMPPCRTGVRPAGQRLFGGNGRAPAVAHVR